jgi:hypothetical protein
LHNADSIQKKAEEGIEVEKEVEQESEKESESMRNG